MLNLPLNLSNSPLDLSNSFRREPSPPDPSTELNNGRSASLLPMLLPFLSEKLRDVRHYLEDYTFIDAVQALKHTPLPPIPEEKIQQFFIWFTTPIDFSLGGNQQGKVELNLSLLDIINLFTQATVQSQQDLPIPHVDIPGSFVLWWLGPEYLISVLAAGGVSEKNARAFVKKHCMHLFSRQPNDFDCRIILENARQDTWDKVIASFEILVGKKLTEKYGEPTEDSSLSKIAKSMLKSGIFKSVFGERIDIVRFLARKMLFTRHPVPVFTKNKDFFYLINLCEPAPFISNAQVSEKRLPIELLLQPDLELSSVQHDKWRLRLEPDTKRLYVVGGEAGGWHYPIDSATDRFRLTRPNDSLHDSEALVRLLLACLCGKHDLCEKDSSEYKRVASQCYPSDLQRIIKKVPQHRNSRDGSLDSLLLAMQLWEFTDEAITDDNLRSFLPKKLSEGKGLAKVLHLALYELKLPFATVSAALKLFAWAQLQERGENSTYCTLVYSEARWALRLEFPIDGQESAFLLLPMDLEASVQAVNNLQNLTAGRQFLCALSRQFSSSNEELKQASQDSQPIFVIPSLEGLLQDWMTTTRVALWEACLGLLPLIPKNCLFLERMISFPTLLPKVRGTEQRCSLLAKVSHWLDVSSSPAYQTLHRYLQSSEAIEAKIFCRLWIHLLLASQQKVALQHAVGYTKDSLDSGVLSNEDVLVILRKITSRCPIETVNFYFTITARLQQSQAHTVLWQLLKELHSLPTGAEVSAALFTLLPAVSNRILSFKSKLSQENLSLLLNFLDVVGSSLNAEESYQFARTLLCNKTETDLHKRVVAVVVGAAIACLNNKQVGLFQELIQELVKQGYLLSDAPEKMQENLSRLLLDQDSLVITNLSLPWKSLRTLRGMCTASLAELQKQNVFQSFADMEELLKVKDIKKIKRELSRSTVINEWDNWIQPLLNASKLQEARLVLLWLLDDMGDFSTEEIERLKIGVRVLLEKLFVSDASALFALVHNPKICQQIEGILPLKMSLINAKQLSYKNRVSVAQECVYEVLKNTSATLTGQIVNQIATLYQDALREPPQLHDLLSLLPLLQAHNLPLQVVKLCKIQPSLGGSETALSICSELLHDQPAISICEDIESILRKGSSTENKKTIQPILVKLVQAWMALDQLSKAMGVLSLVTSYDVSEEVRDLQLTLLSKTIETQNIDVALQAFSQLKSYTDNTKEVAVAEELCVLLYQQKRWAALVTVWIAYKNVLAELKHGEKTVCSLSNFLRLLFDPSSTCKLPLNIRKKALSLVSDATPLSSTHWKYILSLLNNKISPNLVESLGRAFMSHQCDLDTLEVWSKMITKLGSICPQLLEQIYAEPCHKLPLWENSAAWERKHVQFYALCMKTGLEQRIPTVHTFGAAVITQSQHAVLDESRDVIKQLLWIWIGILTVNTDQTKAHMAWTTFAKLIESPQGKSYKPSTQESASIATCVETLLANDPNSLHVQTIGKQLNTLPQQFFSLSDWYRIIHSFQKQGTAQALKGATVYIQSLYYTSISSEKYSTSESKSIALEFKNHLDSLKNNLSLATAPLLSSALSIATKKNLLNVSQQSEYYSKLIHFTIAHYGETGCNGKICATILIKICTSLENALPATKEFSEAWKALLHCSYNSFKGNLSLFDLLDTEIILPMAETLQRQWDDPHQEDASREFIEQMIFSYLHWITNPSIPVFRKANIINDTFQIIAELVLHKRSKKDKALAIWKELVNPLGLMALEVHAEKSNPSPQIANTFADMFGCLGLEDAVLWHLVYYPDVNNLYPDDQYIEAVSKLSETASFASYQAIHRQIHARPELFFSKSFDEKLSAILLQTKALLEKPIAHSSAAQQNLAYLSAQSLKLLTDYIYDKQDPYQLSVFLNSLMGYCRRSCQSLTQEDRKNKQAAATLINIFKNISCCSTNIDALFDVQTHCNGPSCTTNIDAFYDLQLHCIGPLASTIEPLLFETYITEVVIPTLKSNSFTPQVGLQANGFAYLCRLAEVLLKNGPKYKSGSQCYSLLYNADIPAMAGYDKNQITEFTRLLKEKCLHNVEELAIETNQTPSNSLTEQELVEFNHTKALLFCHFAEQLALLTKLWTNEQEKAVLLAHTYSWAQKAKLFLTENPEYLKMLTDFFGNIPSAVENSDQFAVNSEVGNSLRLDLLTLWFNQWKDVKNNEMQGILKNLLNQAIKNGWFQHNVAGMKSFIGCLKSMTH